MNFTVYSKDNCPFCYKVKQVLELTGSNFVVYNLDEHFTKDEFYAEFGEGSTFPQVICDDKKLGGCTDTVKYLKEKQKEDIRQQGTVIFFPAFIDHQANPVLKGTRYSRQFGLKVPNGDDIHTLYNLFGK